MSDETQEPKKPIRGGRNLIILGLISIAIVIVTTTISLYIYRATGDIYLDRSRPGFISESDTSDPIADPVKKFSSDGEVTAETYDEYLKELDTIIENLEESDESFNEVPLSDDSLNIIRDDNN